MNHTERTIPVWKKYSLNVSEAAEYYGIGEKRLRQIAGENEGADFILEVGSHIRFKRKLFEDYLDTASTVLESDRIQIGNENNVHFIIAKRSFR